MDGITNEGGFEDSFRSDVLPGAIGEEHKGTQLFDDIPDVQTLCKRFADTKTAYDKKLDNVIQKPPDDAPDEVKATYRSELATASGAPAAASEYEFFKSEKLPEGMERSQELEDRFRQVFFEHKTPKALVKALSQVFEESQVAAFTSVMETDQQAADEAAKVAAEKADAEQRTFDEGCTALKTEWPGEKLAGNARISLAAIEKFGSDELITNLKKANMYENAADLAAWKTAGIPLATLRLFHKVGLATLDASVLGGGKGGAGSGGTKKSMYARTKAQMGETS